MKKKCYVIMPFSKTNEAHTEEYWNRFFKSLKEIVPESYDVRRSFAAGNIAKQVFFDLATADLVIAVITDNNPNVLYELGMRHSCQQNTIIIVQKGSTVPFYFRSFGLVFYEEDKFDKLKLDLIEQLHNLQGKEKDNPIADVINTQILVAIHRSMAILHRAVDVFSNFPDVEGSVSEIGNSLGQLETTDETQIGVVDVVKEVIVIHRDAVGQKPSSFWGDSTKFHHENKSIRESASLFPEMKRLKSGFFLAPLDDWWPNQKRLSAISFWTVNQRSLIVAEAHFRADRLLLIPR